MLSVVIPAYNEERRLPKTLDRMTGFLDTNGIDYEFIIVDDGSRDATVALVKEYGVRNLRVRLLSRGFNKGRGASVREGILEAKGDLILETDADGSTSDGDILIFLDTFVAHPDVQAIFGSRMMGGSHISNAQPWIRIFLGNAFIIFARSVFWMWNISDFTLGFKMFRREAAKDIFSHQWDDQFVAEAEIIYVAHVRGHCALQLPVTWHDNRDSRVRALRDSLRSLRGMARVLVRRVQGRYAS